MEFQRPVVEIVESNTLPRMYENWTEVYKWYSPWVLTTGCKNLEIMDYGNRKVIQHNIEWSYVEVMTAYENTPDPVVDFNFRRYWLLSFLKDFWRKIYRKARLD